MARFSDFSKFYDELFPEVTPVRNNIVMETPTGEKDVKEEFKEELVDDTMVKKETEENGTGTDNIVDNE